MPKIPSGESRTLNLWLLICLLSFALLMTGCPSSGGSQDENKPAAQTENPVPAGAPEGPVRIAFVPSVEAGKIETQLDEFNNELSELIGHPVESVVVLSYSACVEQMGAERLEAAFLPALAYVLANDRYDVRVVLKAVRRGSATYRGEIITRADSGIETLEDLRGKTMCFVDASSASGYLYPKTLLISSGIDPEVDLKDCTFVGSHPAVIEAVLNGRLDAGACFDDARTTLLETEPRVMEETRVVAYTPDIPADTVSFRAGLEGPFYDRLVQALIEIGKKGKDSPLYGIYEIEELVPAQDSDYDPIRQMVNALNYDIEGEID